MVSELSFTKALPTDNSDKIADKYPSPPIPPPPDGWDTEVLRPTSRCGLPQLHRRIDDPTNHRAIKVLCGTWSCGTCGPYLKNRWEEHLSEKVAETQSAGGSIYRLLVSDEAWGGVNKKIKRLGGNYARLKPENGSYLVFTDVDLGEKLEDSSLEALTKAISSLPYEKRRITTSRAWKLPNPQAKSGDWERVMSVNITIEEAREVVQECGLTPVDLSPDFLAHLGGRVAAAFEFTVPWSWMDNDEEGYQRLLARFRYGPSRFAMAA